MTARRKKKSDIMQSFADVYSPEPSKLNFLNPQQYHLLCFIISRFGDYIVG